MAQAPITRARQHLVIQQFTTYTTEAAVCMLMAGSQTLVNPRNSWVCEITPSDWQYLAQLQLGPDDFVEKQLVQTLIQAAASCRENGTIGVVFFVSGVTLFEPLTEERVLDARQRIEAAIALGKQPPAEKLEAFSDEAIAFEAKRREKAGHAEDENKPALTDPEREQPQG